MTEKYSTHPGGPYDRGAADCYYGRPFAPHYWDRVTGLRVKIEAGDEAYLAYAQGYKDQAESGEEKDWG